MKFYGTKIPPRIEYSQSDMLELAMKVVKSQKTVTGVQPKLSLGRTKMTEDSNIERFTIVGLWGQYILKPQTELYKELPEIEDLTMHLAESVKINTVPHSLIRLKSGEFAYITKRVDRSKKRKYHMEDMCQLTERQTEHKYKGSHEQVAKAINLYTSNPGLEKVNFYELVMFCYLTGNNDMHLKNFSLLKDENKEYNLSPAYDLVASELVVEGDDEELALNLNGKKSKIKKKDFEQAMETSGINQKAAQNIFDKFEKIKPEWFSIIDKSFLLDETKQKYKEMVDIKLQILNK
ncbi:MAG: serine/threonine-protein kinase HipA [Halioglobus sp.]|jgi:serine/threonine-protein kinase HipA